MKKMNMNSRGNQSGFTLIELIVVMVILGIMAATALPKFADLGKDARVAKIKAAAGAINAANANAHGYYLAKGFSGAQTIVLDSNNYTSTAAGYLKASDIVAAAGLDGYSPGTATTEILIQSDSGHATCTVKYDETDHSTTVNEAGC